MRVERGTVESLRVASILLNDATVRHVIWADEERGELEHYRTDAAGRFIRARSGKSVSRERLKGCVKIVLKES